jgi:branched-chain amino acid transport system permease protein
MNRFVGAVPAAARLAVTVLLLAAMGGFLALGWGAAAVLAAYATLFVLAAFPPDPRWKLAALVVLTLEATLGLASKIGGDLLFIALVGVLVLLLRLPKVAVWLKVLLGAAVLLLGIPIAGFANTFLFELGIQIGIYSAMALGLNVVVGMAGLLDMGYAAFFAIGAYTWAIFGSSQVQHFLTTWVPLNGNFVYLFMGLAILATAATGILIGLPALRLRGDYLAIVTLGLGEVVRILANNLDHPLNLTNGPQGITGITKPPIEGFQALLAALGIPRSASTDYQLFFYLLVLVIIGFIVLVNVNLARSKFGRAWVAIREDEIAAKAMGIPMVKTKLLAFATGAAFSGAMGVLFAVQRGFVSPETFTLTASITILGMVVLGGMGSVPGVILGAAALTILNLDLLKGFSEVLNTMRQDGTVLLGFPMSQLPSQVDPAKYERLVFGIILILMMIFRPEGLIPERRGSREEEA